MRRLSVIVRDWPGLVTVGIAVAVAAHLFAAQVLGIPQPMRRLADAPEAVELYLGNVAFSGILAGFAGVLVVFAMTPGVKRFQILRREGGPRLRANWISPVAVSLLAGFASTVAGVLTLTESPNSAVWVFELALLWSVHGALRLLWLLSVLIGLVARADQDEANEPVSLKRIMSA